MERESRKISWTLWAGVALLLATLILPMLLAQLKIRTSIGPPLQVYGSVADFSLTNQNGRPIMLTNLLGRVWVADIIFTRCPGPCLKMSRQMKDLETALPPRSDSRLVTLTTDPDYDTPAVLKAYAQRFDANTSRWMFLTGSKREIGNLAIGSLKLTAIEKKPEERESSNDLFIHSTIFVLVDRQGRLRGVFDTTGEGVDPVKVKEKILAGVRRLERER